MRQLIFVLLMSLISVPPAVSMKMAVTDEGERVILKEDGTWKYAQTEFHDKDQRPFRKTRWGMSRRKVREVERARPFRVAETAEGLELLEYRAILAGLRTKIRYIFVKDRLIEGQYLFEEIHKNLNDYLTDYSELQSILTEKYGSSQENQDIWLNDHYRNDPEKIGFAVSRGDYTKFAKWDQGDTEIKLFISGKGHKIDLSLVYVSKELKPLEAGILKKSAKDQF